MIADPEPGTTWRELNDLAVIDHDILENREIAVEDVDQADFRGKGDEQNVAVRVKRGVSDSPLPRLLLHIQPSGDNRGRPPP